VIALKQGAGRLIRSETDRGVLVLCDPRLVGKSYGKVFLDSLPPLPKTRRIEDAVAFFAPASIAGSAAEPGLTASQPQLHLQPADKPAPAPEAFDGVAP
jgi:ATP-dependent DNA helicase DinG